MRKETNKQLKKLNLKWGTIYVEPYQSKTNEEENRSKIYDEFGNYIDYINTEHITEKQYNDILCEHLLSKGVEDFIENGLLIDSYDYCENLIDLLDCVFGSTFETDEDFEQYQKDIETKSEEELMEKYYINKIGKWYIFLNV